MILPVVSLLEISLLVFIFSYTFKINTKINDAILIKNFSPDTLQNVLKIILANDAMLIKNFSSDSLHNVLKLIISN